MKYGIYTFILEGYLNKYLKKPEFAKFNNSLETGWGNGYVLIPNKHPFYNLYHDDIDISIHGGLTYSKLFNPEKYLKCFNEYDYDGDVTLDNINMFNDYWIIGFDTAHYGDNEINCTKEFVMRESKNLLNQCLNDKIDGIKKYKTNIDRRNKLNRIENI